VLDLKRIREDPEGVKAALRRRGPEQDAEIDRVLAADARRRELLAEVEQLKAERNQISEQVSQLKRSGGDAETLIAQSRALGERIAELDDQVRTVEAEQEAALLLVPNLPDADVPDGTTEEENVIVRTWGQPRRFDFPPKPHWEIGEALGIMDFERASKLSGSMFDLLKGPGARLRRALIDFMLDVHTREHGYTEVWPPSLVLRRTLVASGHLPKFEADQFHVPQVDGFLIPTAESPLANLHRDEILSADDLPLYYVAYTPCFRDEKVSAGKESRGMIRRDQFDKVELFKYCLPEQSAEELEKLVANAETIYQRLGLPYRTVVLCAGEMGTASAKTYDPMAWFPGLDKWLELSSCSNCRDWQGRRANLRFRRNPRSKPEFVHTLNGSGLAVGRTLACVVENYQQADGSVRVPEALAPYMGGLETIGPPPQP
jgi:seryl-tRNA synthetase